MHRKGRKIFTRLLALALLAGVSATTQAAWQGTWLYYNAEGALVGSWTAGCGEADGRWGETTSRRTFIQGCSVAW